MLISTVATFGSWLFIRERLRASSGGNTHQARLLALSFLLSTLYGLFMLLPHVLISFKPEYFPFAMALGFTIGHVFLYLSFTQMFRLTFSLIPRLSDKETVAIGIGIFATVVLTALTASTMLLGTRPEFSASEGITIFNTHELVDVGNGLVGLILVVPAALLMIYNGITNNYLRLRSFLIGGGMIILMIAGPMIEGAKEPMIFALSNSLSVLGLLVMTVGIAYRMNENISLAHAPVKPNR
jgi:hypothetical protein